MTKLSDEELNSFLHELGLYEKNRIERKPAPLPTKKRGPSSLKISLYIILTLVLFSIVQAAFTLPLYTRLKKIESLLQQKSEESLPEEFAPEYPSDETIEIIEEQSVYKNA